LAARPP